MSAERHRPRGVPPSPARARRARWPALAAAIATLGLAGCGGQTVTKQDVIARGNAICAGSLRDIRAVPPPAGAAGSPAVLAAYLKRVVPILDKEIFSLRALPRPAQDHSLLNRYVAAVNATAAQYRSLAVAAQAGDSGAVAQALAALRTSPAAALAAQYGLSQCATAAGTGVS